MIFIIDTNIVFSGLLLGSISFIFGEYLFASNVLYLSADLSDLKTFVLDEADRMMDMGFIEGN